MVASTLHPYFSYADPAYALSWLAEAFGFEVVTSQAGDDGRILHAEMRVGDGVIMIGQNDDLHKAPGKDATANCPGTYVVIENVDTHHASAAANGARIVFPPEDTGWGARRYRALDHEGYEWSFGSYRPGTTW